MATRNGHSGSIVHVNGKTTEKLLGDDKFLALEEQVTVIPRFTTDEPVECIKGEFGPFRAHSVARVPLWAALEMERLRKCTIEVPLWLQEDELKRLRDEEQQVEVLAKVHDHYIEIALALLSQSNTFAANKAEKSRIGRLLRDIIELRRNKILEALKGEIEVHQEALAATGMSATERTCFRTRSLLAVDHFLGLLGAQKKTEVKAMETEGEDTLQDEDSSRLP